MINWSYSQWWLCVRGAVDLLGALCIGWNVAHVIWPAWLAWPGFALACAGWAAVTILVHETRAERSQSRLLRMGP